MHDVGKIAIPNEIINKPGKLDPYEWQVIKTHTIEGQALLDRVGGFMSDVGRIVRSHHERWDGSGYPDGLAGEAIPLEARIIAACDSWNAMTTCRSYRDALTPERGARGAHRLLRHPARSPHRRHPARDRVRRHPHRRAEPVGRGGLATGSKGRRFNRAVVIEKRGREFKGRSHPTPCRARGRRMRRTQRADPPPQGARRTTTVDPRYSSVWGTNRSRSLRKPTWLPSAATSCADTRSSRTTMSWHS